jgi:hypothetical protein
LLVVSAVDDTHATCADLLDNAVVTQHLTDELGGGGHRSKMLGAKNHPGQRKGGRLIPLDAQLGAGCAPS